MMKKTIITFIVLCLTLAGACTTPNRDSFRIIPGGFEVLEREDGSIEMIRMIDFDVSPKNVVMPESSAAFRSRRPPMNIVPTIEQYRADAMTATLIKGLVLPKSINHYILSYDAVRDSYNPFPKSYTETFIEVMEIIVLENGDAIQIGDVISLAELYFIFEESYQPWKFDSGGWVISEDIYDAGTVFIRRDDIVPLTKGNEYLLSIRNTTDLYDDDTGYWPMYEISGLIRPIRMTGEITDHFQMRAHELYGSQADAPFIANSEAMLLDAIRTSSSDSSGWLRRNTIDVSLELEQLEYGWFRPAKTPNGSVLNNIEVNEFLVRYTFLVDPTQNENEFNVVIFEWMRKWSDYNSFNTRLGSDRLSVRICINNPGFYIKNTPNRHPTMERPHGAPHTVMWHDARYDMTFQLTMPARFSVDEVITYCVAERVEVNGLSMSTEFFDTVAGVLSVNEHFADDFHELSE
jgi:hypothetical protein